MSLSTTALRPLRPARKLTAEVISRLTEEIVAGKLAPRTRLPTEHALMQAFGVSRTVVREAIAVLRAEGLVETRQGAGAFVAADPSRRPFRLAPEGLQSIEQVLDVLELRICVEVEAAGLAAERRRRTDLSRLARNNAAFAETIAKGDLAVDLDYDFHAAVGSATGNPFFSSFLDFIGRIIIPRRTVHLEVNSPALMPYLQRILQDHTAIERAIAAADVGAARRAMHSHLARARTRYRLLAEERPGR